MEIEMEWVRRTDYKVKQGEVYRLISIIECVDGVGLCIKDNKVEASVTVGFESMKKIHKDIGEILQKQDLSD